MASPLPLTARNVKPRYPGYRRCRLRLIWSQSLSSRDQAVEPLYREPAQSEAIRPEITEEDGLMIYIAAHHQDAVIFGSGRKDASCCYLLRPLASHLDADGTLWHAKKCQSYLLRLHAAPRATTKSRFWKWLAWERVVWSDLDLKICRAICQVHWITLWHPSSFWVSHCYLGMLLLWWGVLRLGGWLAACQNIQNIRLTWWSGWSVFLHPHLFMIICSLAVLLLIRLNANTSFPFIKL